MKYTAQRDKHTEREREKENKKQKPATNESTHAILTKAFSDDKRIFAKNMGEQKRNKNTHTHTQQKFSYTQREREMFMPHAYRSKPSHCLSLSLSYSHTQTPIYSHHTHNKAQKLCGIKGGVVSILQLIHNSKSVNHAPELHSS